MRDPSKIIVGDADSLIALVNDRDIHYTNVRRIVSVLEEKSFTILYPNTAILEAITTLKRKLNLAAKAELLARQFLQGVFMVVWVDEDIQKDALERFMQKARSKQHTVFDSIVASCVKRVAGDGVLSFDRWYRTLAIPLAEDLMD
ncbi:PIN domain-containing protein [Candidatus Gottesmanbacteria bacterium]|nr:PIN domain-containing protein [Candidatus Gottesmanbacteria bacterium]